MEWDFSLCRTIPSLRILAMMVEIKKPFKASIRQRRQKDIRISILEFLNV